MVLVGYGRCAAFGKKPAVVQDCWVEEAYSRRHSALKREKLALPTDTKGPKIKTAYFLRTALAKELT